MTHRKAFMIIGKALAYGSVLALTVLLYSLYVAGVFNVGFLLGFSTALLLLTLVVFGALVTFSDEVKHGG